MQLISYDKSLKSKLIPHGIRHNLTKLVLSYLPSEEGFVIVAMGN